MSVAQPADLPPALLIAGPTASGKSALALALAERFGGTVINADSMQVYRELRVLTARPTPAEEARARHALYGVRPAAEAGTVAWWRGAALAEMAKARLPILCGGTGMYFSSLTQGLASIPAVPPWAREEARARLAAEGPAALHAALDALDGETAATLRPSDSQRIARAYEVVRGTGQGLSYWLRACLKAGGAGPAPYRFAGIWLDPPREALRTAITARWAAMIEGGAIEEVRALSAQELDPALPAMRAHGVPELLAFLEGRMTLAAASARAILNTGQYTKRQATWFRHHALAEAPRTQRFGARYQSSTQDSESLFDYCAAFFDNPR